MDYETEWDCSKYIVKAILFGHYAQNEPTSSPLYRFWCSLYLEMLARASLAKIHPVLLADPRDAKNILYAFGVFNNDPKSIPAKTLYSRCNDLIHDFDKEALEFSVFISQARNKELHSGESGFGILGETYFRLKHYRVTKILCDYLGEEITDFFNEEDISEIEEMLKKNIEDLKGRANDKVRKSKKKYQSLNDKERKDFYSDEYKYLDNYAQKTCPSCQNLGKLLGGRIENIKRDIQSENHFIETTTYASKQFFCNWCKLDLNREELEAVGLPISFKINEEGDLTDFIDFDRELEYHPDDIYGSDYMNE